MNSKPLVNSRNRFKGIMAGLTFSLCTTLFTSCLQEYLGDDTYNNLPGNPIVHSSIIPDKFLFTFWSDNASTGNNYYETRELSSTPGNSIFNGRDMGQWQCMVGVQVGQLQFLVSHSIWTNEYGIRSVENSGIVKDFIDRGRWNNSYECFVGFHVGNRGFIFGQDSENSSGHYWFVQEITQSGRLGTETDNGKWHNTYSCVPLYVGTETYLFFLEGGDSNNGGYWFISHVSSDGVLHDVDSGHFIIKIDALASCIAGGNTYLVSWSNNTNSASTFILNRVNSDGTLGNQTGNFDSDFSAGHMAGFESRGKGYIVVQNNGSPAYFIKEVTSDGKWGTTTYSGYLAQDYMQLVPLNLKSPGNFRFEIGWDLSKTSGSPGWWSPMYAESWTSQTGFGGGAALAKINNDDLYDALFVGTQNYGITDKRFYYQIAWGLDNTGKPTGWSQTMYGPYCGPKQAGAGADIADIDGNGIPDLVLMYIEDPDGSNAFRYCIGWNLDAKGIPVSWSDQIRISGLGWNNSGGGAALGDIDQNGSQDLILMGIDNPSGTNKFWYRIGRNLDKAGHATSWTSMLSAPVILGDLSAGGGAALADVNGNGKLDLVLTHVDSPSGPNDFWSYIGWDIDINGNVTGWSGKITGTALGNMTSGGGTAVADINKNGIPDLLLMTVDNPYGAD